MISLNELDRMFQQGHFKDYNLVEYDFLKYFIKQTSPKNICVIGGSTNIDLFYSCQNQNIDIINFDRPSESMTTFYQKIKHNEYKKKFSFQGNYTWINRFVNNMSQIENYNDFLMLNAHIDMIYEIMDSKKFPKSLVVSHYGNIFHAEGLNHIADHIPLVCMSTKMAFFTFEKIVIDKTNFIIDQSRNFFQHDSVNRLIS